MISVELTEDAFANTFRPKANYLNPNASFDWGEGYGTLYETYGDELAFVKSQSADTVWTLLSGDGDVIVSGFHFVNRLGYFITELPVPPGLDISIPLESVDSDETFPVEILTQSATPNQQKERMEKPLTLTIQIAIDPSLRSPALQMTRLLNMLKLRLSDLLAEDPNGLRILSTGPIPKALDVETYLAEKDQMAFIWSVDDVQSVRPDLTDEQAWEVLLHAKRNHDANFGINWDVLSVIAESLYGDAPEPKGDDV